MSDQPKQIIQHPAGGRPPVHTKTTTRSYVRPNATSAPVPAALADPGQDPPPSIPELVDADPGHHTSDHQSVVQGAAPVVSAQTVSREDEASAPAARPVDTRSSSRSRTRHPAQPPSTHNAGPPAPAYIAADFPVTRTANVPVTSENDPGDVPVPAAAADDQGSAPATSAKPPRESWVTNRPRDRPQNTVSFQDPATAAPPASQVRSGEADPTEPSAPPITAPAEPAVVIPAAQTGGKNVRIDRPGVVPPK